MLLRRIFRDSESSPFTSILQVVVQPLHPQHFGTVPEPESAQDEAVYGSLAFNFPVSIFVNFIVS